MKTAPLWAYADVRPSNVDKKSKPNERVVRLVNYTDVYYNQIITTEFDLMIATASDEHIERFGVLPGDIIITKDSETPDDIGIPAQIVTAEDDMVCAYHLTLLRPWRDRTYSRYLYWVLESATTKDYWLTSSFGVTRYSIGSGVVSRLPVVDVDLDAQRAIADYLDRETGEIDAMIAKMDELAGTLKARRETVVLESIRRQDNLALHSLRLAASLVTGSTPAGGQEANFSETGTMGWVTPEDLASPVRASRFLSAAGLGQLRVIPGCSVLVCCIGATVGKLGYADQPITTNQQITAVVPRQGISGRYLYYALTAEHSQILSEAVTTTLPIINNARLGGLAVRIPSQSAQHRIADHLDEVTGKIDAMLAKVAELKSLLIERRAALITEVVTGRKKVA